MKTYIGTKVITARPMTRQQYNDYRGWQLPANENGADEGYLVEYLDGGQSNHPDHAGYISWSPKDVFERAYRPVIGLTFSAALEALKLGLRVSRTGWNGKGMWIGLHSEIGEFVREACGTTLTYRDYIVMKTVDDQLVPWVASQTDLLAEDWGVVEGAA